MQNFFFKCFSENSISKIFPLKNCFGNFSKERQNSFFSLFSKHHWCKIFLPDFFYFRCKTFFFSFLSESFIFQFFLIKILFHFFLQNFSLEKVFWKFLWGNNKKVIGKGKKIRSDPACGDQRIDHTFNSSWALVN